MRHENSLSIRPLNVGAEIAEVPADPADPAVQAALSAAWLQYGLLLFRGVETIEHHLALSACFGELEEHPIAAVRAREHHLFMEVGGETSSAYVYDQSEIKTGTVPWHRDTAYTPDISKGALLRMVETPPAGGETLFADTAAAYDDLPGDVQQRLASLEYKATLRSTPMDQTGPGAIWNSVRPLSPEERAELGLQAPDRAKAAAAAGFPSVVHPAVIAHPESGRMCIFLSPKEFDCFLGLEPAESDQLSGYLVGHMLQDRYIYQHTWAVNDVMAWDNRRFMHAAAGNRVGDRRRGLRTTLAGDLTAGRVFSPA